MKLPTIKKHIKRSALLLGATVFSAFATMSQAATIDLLVLYDNYSRDYFGGDPQTAMNSWVNQMNAAYRDSQVDIQLRLVGVRHNEQNGATMGDVLGNLRNNSSMVSLRDQLGADFVSQLHRTGACGVGYVSVDKNWTWNVTGPNCGPIVMAHELGHNMGLNHSRRQGNASGARFRYGVGHGVDNSFVSIMAYEQSFNARRVSRFSNPNISCNGLPCGVPVGNPQEAHAALAIHNVRDEMANFRSSATASGPVIVSEHCSYGGYNVALPEGSYTMGQLQARGIRNDDVSSIRVQSGYTATLYQHDNFTGNAITRTGNDTCLVGAGFNDTVTSIRVARTTSSGFSRTVQAENFSANNGVQTGPTNDSGGGLSVGWIDTNDWMAYNSINIPTSGTYTIEYRISSVGGGRISLDLNGGSTVLGEIAVPNTGSWETWRTISHKVNINAGTYNFGVFAKAGGWNINWFRISR